MILYNSLSCETICWLHSVFGAGRRVLIYQWFLSALRDNFETVRPLKEGARGWVHLVRHRSTGRLFILRRFTGSAEVYRKLLDVRCPNLPEIFEVARQGEENLVLEEFVEGDTLGFLLKEALFSQQETRAIVAQICQGLWALHSMDAVHRDVKPENVILRGSQAVLIDFDAARLHKPELDTDTQILGTAGFAAPEQYGMSQSDIRADIYALGILINVMLTGEHPSKKQAKGPLGRVVGRCTRINPEKRYRNVQRLLEAL